MLKRTSLLAIMISAALLAGCNESQKPTDNPANDNAASAPATASTAPAPAADTNTDTSPGLVKVNGELITQQLFATYFLERRRQNPDEELTQESQIAALDELVTTVLLAQHAEATGLASNPEVAAALELARQKILAEAAIAQILKDNNPTPEAIQARYDELAKAMPTTEYKARHILLETEDDAKAVIVELDQGADFAEIAKAKSTGPSGANGGDLGWFSPNQMVKPFSDATAALDKGKYSATPVKTQFGWHVILLEDVRESSKPEMDQVKGQISQQIANQLRRQAVKDNIIALKDKADIELLGAKQDTDGTPAESESTPAATSSPDSDAAATPATDAG